MVSPARAISNPLRRCFSLDRTRGRRQPPSAPGSAEPGTPAGTRLAADGSVWNTQPMKRRLCALAMFLVLAAGMRADEIRLKDGSKIVGTIVDFENDSFKVQTSYGFALVRKDSIAQIIPSEPVRPSDPARAVPPVPSPARSASAPAT